MRRFKKHRPAKANISGRRYRFSKDSVRLEPVFVSRYSEAPIVALNGQAHFFATAFDELSLADINRYAFRRNRSRKLDLAVPKREVEVGSR